MQLNAEHAAQWCWNVYCLCTSWVFFFFGSLSLTLWSRPLRSRCRPSPSCPAEVPAGPPGEDGSGEGVTAVCSPWWPVVRGLSQSRAGHFGGGQRGAPSDESRLIHLSLLWGRGSGCGPVRTTFEHVWTKKQNKKNTFAIARSNVDDI